MCASVDASAVIGFEPFDHDTVQALQRAGDDVVIPTDVMVTPPATAQVGRVQAEHLIARGHRRIGYALPEHSGYRQMAEGRLRGVTEQTAAWDVGAVLSVAADAAGEDLSRRILLQLPPGYDLLFGRTEHT